MSYDEHLISMAGGDGDGPAPSNGMTDVLVAHQRQNSSGCLCSWAELGKSHPEHQTAMLTAAGFGPVKEAAAQMASVRRVADRIEAAAHQLRAAAVRGES